MPKGRRSAGVVTEKAEVAKKAEAVDGLWGVAMLRVAMELKRPEAAGLEDIIAGITERMGIDRAAFEQYLKDNLGLLKATVKQRGYER